jgi:hypothetical protein
MTTLYEQEVTCAICGNSDSYTFVGSTSVFGPPDLDTRPAMLARANLEWEIQRCKTCGYCTSDVSAEIPNAGEVARSEEYKRQLNDDERPRLAVSFLANALLNEHARDYAAAGWASLRAAWACDDAHNDPAARFCRVRAASNFERASQLGQHFVEPPVAGGLLLTDVLRRAGEFERARERCSFTAEQTTEPFILSLLDFERRLIAEQNTDAHTVSEIDESDG